MNVKEVTASANGVLSGKYKIIALYLAGGSTNSSAIVYDNATAQSGTVMIKLVALANDGNGINLKGVAPMTDNGISVTMGGTGTLFIYYA